MPSRTPQLLITLTPDGHLAVELPGQQSTRRQIVLRPSEAGATLLRILEAQGRSGAEIGQDGAPTAAQVRHWERHSIWKDQHCRFCIAEGTPPDYSSARQRTKSPPVVRRDGVEVRRFRERATGTSVVDKTVEELGL